MIDLNATIQKAGITRYRFSQIIERASCQVYDWCSGKKNLSELMDSHIKLKCFEKGIEIVEKE